ncbi:alpha/beta hydrolase [Galbibacter mesophilus]|uniref:alpha/beta hydrolase n=1 Tax=Galbibacter mesophilus TaxID=379069 RepID=UPI00191E1462|nr:alpha/beta hydrolase [Galbibacter mesophilus]MCM5661669.1 alpha/beta hydrolase [Galbibacter mesophilus]
MKKLLILFFLTSLAWSQEKPVLGKVTDALSITHSKDTYSVYLPTDYTSDRKWPVILVFDPNGRGALATEKFKEASEKYGYIIAASNGVKNSTYQENLNIARNFYAEVLQAYSADENNIYVAGFSGGARLAVTIAVISKNVKGVIACGASFANNEMYTPKKNNFLFVGVVGDEDFNYREMKLADEYLTKRKFDAELVFFSGGHVWPPKETINKAVRLLTLQSMTRNIIPRNDEEIAQFYAEDLAYNETLRTQLEMYRAYNDLDDMMENYRFYFEKDTLKELQKEIRRTKLYRSQRSDHAFVNMVEPNYYIDYVNFFPKDVASGELNSLSYWEGEVTDINKEYINSASAVKKRMGKRILNFMKILPSEMKTSYKEPEQTQNLLYLSIYSTIVDPTDYESYYPILKYSVQSGDYGMALFYLDKMLANGYKDIETLRQQDGITLLRIQPEYNELLESYGFDTMY